MNLIDSPSLQLATRFLDLAAYRQQLVAGNIANIDTPGYRTRDIDFQQELQRSLATSSSNSAAVQPKPEEVPGLMERPDGNNVSVDREAMALAQSQLQFRIGVAVLRHEIHMVSTAINEGKQ